MISDLLPSQLSDSSDDPHSHVDHRQHARPRYPVPVRSIQVPVHRTSGQILQQQLVDDCIIFTDESTIIVTGLPLYCPMSELTRLFKIYGPIVYACYRHTDVRRPEARIVFRTTHMAKDAIRGEHGRILRGSVLTVTVRVVPLAEVTWKHVQVDQVGRVQPE